MTYAKVNQRDIRRTICKKGWTSTVRPPEAYTARLKIVQIRQYGPNPKDKVENALRRAVCDGRVRLAPAQRAIARNWMTAERNLGLAK